MSALRTMHISSCCYQAQTSIVIKSGLGKYFITAFLFVELPLVRRGCSVLPRLIHNMNRGHRQQSYATLITVQHSCFLYKAESSCSEGGSRLFHRAKWNTGPNKRSLGPRIAGLLVSAWLFRQARLIREAEKCQRAAKLVEELDLTHQQNRSGRCRRIKQHNIVSLCSCCVRVGELERRQETKVCSAVRKQGQKNKSLRGTQ